MRYWRWLRVSWSCVQTRRCWALGYVVLGIGGQDMAELEAIRKTDFKYYPKCTLNPES